MSATRIVGYRVKEVSTRRGVATLFEYPQRFRSEARAAEFAKALKAQRPANRYSVVPLQWREANQEAIV